MIWNNWVQKSWGYCVCLSLGILQGDYKWGSTLRTYAHRNLCPHHTPWFTTWSSTCHWNGKTPLPIAVIKSGGRGCTGTGLSVSSSHLNHVNVWPNIWAWNTIWNIWNIDQTVWNVPNTLGSTFKFDHIQLITWGVFLINSKFLHQKNILAPPSRTYVKTFDLPEARILSSLLARRGKNASSKLAFLALPFSAFFGQHQKAP